MLIYGIIVGVALAFIFGYGVSFFAMIQASAQYGFRRTLPFVYGIILSDIVMVYLMVAVLASWLGLDTLSAFIERPAVLIVGAAVFVGMGVFTMTRKTSSVKEKGKNVKFESKDDPKWLSLFYRGFGLNTLNPLVWLFWLSVILVLTPMMGDRPEGQMYVLVAGVMIGELGSNVLKCWLSALLQRILSARVMNIFNKIVGVVLIGFAVYIVWTMVLFKDSKPENNGTTPADVLKVMTPPSDSSRGLDTGFFHIK